MIRLAEKQTLTVVKKVEFGVYLAESKEAALEEKVLLPITSAADLGTVPAELVGSFNLIFYRS